MDRKLWMKNADGKLWMEKCGWKNVDGKMSMTKCGWKIANDYILMIIKLWFLMTVPVVNEPGYFIKFRPEEVDTFYSVTKQIKIFLLWQIQKKKKMEQSWSNYDRLNFPFIVWPCFSFTALKDFHSLFLKKFSVQKTGIVKLNETPLHVQWLIMSHCTLVWSICIHKKADDSKADDSSTSGRAWMMEFI